MNAKKLLGVIVSIFTAAGVVIFVLGYYTQTAIGQEFSVFSQNNTLNWLLLYTFCSISNKANDWARGDVSRLERAIESVWTFIVVCVYTAWHGPLLSQWAETATIMNEFMPAAVVNSIGVAIIPGWVAGKLNSGGSG